MKSLFKTHCVLGNISLPSSHTVSFAKNADFLYCLANSHSSFKIQLHIPCFGKLFVNLPTVQSWPMHTQNCPIRFLLLTGFSLLTSLGLEACLNQQSILSLLFLPPHLSKIHGAAVYTARAQQMLRSKNSKCELEC